jgi:integrase/recombinase XerD
MSDTTTVSPLRQRMIEDMAARKLNPHTQRSHIQSCKRFAAWLKSPCQSRSRAASRRVPIAHRRRLVPYSSQAAPPVAARLARA